ncbi:hypothetical protein K488DRAFT_79136 [Vararia minispora EC-137]|uniref:Uncharacterized protein n=1 Tax=Vararia minispora EC-137 TaxID=1314806 RepID=A0ACB8QHJ7_9AGAM|nr:hypothetical protein K488DRAFT_79136 [Vararia minispora EC-137]
MPDRHFRIGAAGAHRGTKRLDKRLREAIACTTGGFYQSPTAGQTIDYQQAFNISWDTSCMSASEVDIYLYSPSSSQSIIHLWENVYFKSGSYQTNLQPKWWNSTSSVSLYLTIVASGTQPFMATIPAGPVFTATYTAPSSGGTPASADTSTSSNIITTVNNAPSTKHGPSKGAIAAAVLVPLIVIGLLILGCYIRIKRGIEKEKRRRFSVKVDQRMSTINPDWQSLSGAGANAAIRNSIAVNAGSRVSVFGGTGVRPISTVTDGGRAGIGARSVLPGSSNPEMSQLRPGVRASAVGAERVSRVSFAPDTRPSLDSRKSVASRAFHTGVVPPLPTRSDSESTGTPTGIMSPTQAAGPIPLSVDDIQARLSGQETAARPSVDEVMPALRMMRTADGEELLSPTTTAPYTPSSAVPFLVSMPTPPTPTLASPTSLGASAMSSFMPMPTAAGSMSPDDMLRAYAGRRVASPPVGPTAPAPTYGNMTPLYAVTTAAAPPTTVATVPARKSLAPTEGSRYSQYSSEDVYGGTAQ